MDENLQRLVKDLREERCPPRVLENVASRIPRRPDWIYRMRLATVGFAVVIAALLAVLGLWQWPNRESRGPAQTVVPRQADPVQVAQEAGAALAYIGSVLLEAGRQTETILLNEAVPPLRSGFESATQTIKDKI